MSILYRLKLELIESIQITLQILQRTDNYALNKIIDKKKKMLI